MVLVWCQKIPSPLLQFVALSNKRPRSQVSRLVLPSTAKQHTKQETKQTTTEEAAATFVDVVAWCFFGALL